MGQGRRAAATRMPRVTAFEARRAPERQRPPESAERVVSVHIINGVWRVSAAHMEPLRFRAAEEAEKTGHRVAQTLARLGFDARVETHDAAGAVIATQVYPARIAAAPSAPRRQLDS